MHIVGKEDVKSPFFDKDGIGVYRFLGTPAELGASKGYSLIVNTIPAGGAGPEHYHLEEEETYIVISGLGQVVIDGQPHEMKPGTACLISPKEKHYMANVGDETLEFYCVCAPPWTAEDSYPREN